MIFLGPWKQVQSAVKAIQEMARTQENSEPIVITYNTTVEVTNLDAIARTNASGSTDFVKGT